MGKKKNNKAWELIADTLTKDILASKYPPNVALPGEHHLCEQYGVSRTTVRRAMADLEKRGLVYRQAGRGTFAYPIQDMHLPPQGLLIKRPDKLASNYFMELINGCNSYLYSIGSHISILSTSPKQWSQRMLGSLSGVIVIPTDVTAEELAVLDASGCGYTIMTESDLPGPSITMNIEAAAYELTKYLIDKGHQQFALVSGHHMHADNHKRQGIARAITEAGFSIDSVPDFCTDYKQDLARQAALRLLDTTKRPTAIIGFNDSLAMQVMSVATELGISIPSELSVVGFNNSPFGSLTTPPLTTVNLPIHEAGKVAAQQLASHYLHDTPIQNQTLESNLIIRQSVAQAPR